MIIEKVENGVTTKKKIFEQDLLSFLRKGWKPSKDKDIPVVKKTFEKKVEDNAEEPKDDNDFSSFRKRK